MERAVYLPDFENFYENESEFKKIISEIPLEYSLSKKDFQNIAKVDNTHLSREINKVRKKLISKVIHTPHPLYMDDKNSGISLTWFTKIDYSSKEGKILIKLNPEAIERLVAFVKYSRISFNQIINIQSSYAIYTYLLIKILKDSSSLNKLQFTIDEFKEKIGLNGKYKVTNLFKEKVLDVITREINEYTELVFDYKLSKGESGKALKYINITFDYKTEYLEQKSKSKSKKTKQLNVIENTYIDNNESPFEHILTGWNIRAKKVVEIEETYSLDVIQSAIELTLEKEKEDEIKTTKAAIFLGILENKQQSSDEVFEREQQQLAKQDEKERIKALGAEYDAIQKVINDNDDEIASYLSAKAMGATYEISPTLNEQLINMSCVGTEKFKGFRHKLAVLHNGYFDMKLKKEVRPNMYDFLILII